MQNPQPNRDKKENRPDRLSPRGALRLLATSPINILREAIRAVPALKYALGVLGIVAAISIAVSLKVSFRVAVIGTLIMIVLMTALVIFAALTQASGALRIAATIMMFAFLFLTIGTATLLFTSVFFKWPLHLQHWVTDPPPSSTPTPTPTSSPSPPMDSASIVLKEKRTLKSAIEHIAELDDSRAQISYCSPAFLNSVIRGGPVQAETIEKLIEQLQFRIPKPKTRERYRVIKKEQEKTYDIQCTTN